MVHTLEFRPMKHDEESHTVIYGLIREEYILYDRTRIAYGVAAYAHPSETATAAILTAVRDITAHRESAEALVALCNRLALSPAHLADVIDDFFGS